MIFEAAEEPIISHAIAPVTLEVSAQGLAEGRGIGGALYAGFEKTLYLRGTRRPEVAQWASGLRTDFIFPAHAQPPPA